MNNMQTLADLFGSKSAVADIFGVHPSYVTRLTQGEGRVPIRYNAKVRAAMREKAVEMGGAQAVAFVEAIERCLAADVCPTCHRPLDDGQVV